MDVQLLLGAACRCTVQCTLNVLHLLDNTLVLFDNNLYTFDINVSENRVQPLVVINRKMLLVGVLLFEG